MNALPQATAHRTRVATSTSACGGWAARLAELRAKAQGATEPSIQRSTSARTPASSRGASEASSSARA